MFPLLLAFTLIEPGWCHNLPNAQLYNHRSNGNPTAFGLLSLRLREKSYCEGEKAAFKCPMHTQIAIDEVFYGHSARTAEICAIASTKKRTTTEGRNGTKRKVDYNIRMSSQSNDSCEFATETCQNKRRCWIKTGARDPALNNCSQIGRHFQVSYRCRPSQFNGEFFCDNQLMSLSCLQGQRLAIHSAFYRSVPPKGSGNCQKTPSELYIGIFLRFQIRFI
ncbi:Gal Lectin domain containing protein [Trichuris trichiura]|uniref:Gal Lectin domain containing protein n=1 Tax=Trichuris trichiura TaxID=36087 RepID=A0A077ZH58_TRITR|nr:Gal Lectin domain containing protein [Trichuris trichiura]